MTRERSGEERLLRLVSGLGLLLAAVLLGWQLQVLPERPASRDWLMLAGNGAALLVFGLFAFFPERLRACLRNDSGSPAGLVMILALLLIGAAGFTIHLMLEGRWFPALVMLGVTAGVFDALRRTLAGEASSAGDATGDGGGDRDGR